MHGGGSYAGERAQPDRLLTAPHAAGFQLVELDGGRLVRPLV